ncbi:MAG: glycosyltransferase [Rhodocyclaceae bacterium]
MATSRLHILYLGPVSGTCLDRANALRRLGHQVEHIELRRLLPATPWVDRITWRLGGQYFERLICARLPAQLQQARYDLCYVDGGEWVTPRVIATLRRVAGRVLAYSIDDPFGPRDGRRYTALRQSQPFYDLQVVVRPVNQQEALALGARKVLRVFMTADEISHAPRELAEGDHETWDSEVLFLGTWFPERGPFLLDLLRRGVPLSIRGPNWHKAPEWSQLKACWKGGAVAGDDYAKALQCAKLNLGLLSKGNRDMHTTRSMEIPALGALLCAERTAEHTAMYAEGVEALFWSDAEECAAVSMAALADEPRRLAIAQAGHARLGVNAHYNEPTLARILDEAFSGTQTPVAVPA